MNFNKIEFDGIRVVLILLKYFKNLINLFVMIKCLLFFGIVFKCGNVILFNISNL